MHGRSSILIFGRYGGPKLLISNNKDIFSSQTFAQLAQILVMVVWPKDEDEVSWEENGRRKTADRHDSRKPVEDYRNFGLVSV